MIYGYALKAGAVLPLKLGQGELYPPLDLGCAQNEAVLPLEGWGLAGGEANRHCAGWRWERML
jgi:hypothetical protein